VVLQLSCADDDDVAPKSTNVTVNVNQRISTIANPTRGAGIQDSGDRSDYL
jgi:hypothetical protein